MNHFKRILLASDFIKHSHTTSEAAIEVAKELKAKLVLTHVIHETSSLEFKDEMLKKLDNWAMDLEKQGASVYKAILKEGEISQEVLKTAQEEECGIIMVGYGKNETVKKGKIGSYAKQIINKSDRPVLLIKQHVKPLFKNILCAVDILETSRPVLEWAIAISKLCNSELVVLHAIPNEDISASSEDEIENKISNTRIHAEKHLDKFLAKSDFEGVKWKKVIINNIAPEFITEYAEINSSSLIIVGQSYSNKLEQFLFGSMPQKILELSDIPVLLVKG